MFGLFDNMFDFNHDGKLDGFEQSVKVSTMMGLFEEEEKSYGLSSAGLDRDELEFMGEDERREALEDAGLDPDDYDDLFF